MSQFESCDREEVRVDIPMEGGVLHVTDDPDGVGGTSDLTLLKFVSDEGPETELPWMDRAEIVSLIQALVFRLRVNPGEVRMADIDPQAAAIEALQDAISNGLAMNEDEDEDAEE